MLGKHTNSEGEALLEDVRTESDLKSKHLCVFTLVQRVVCRPTFSVLVISHNVYQSVHMCDK